MRRADRLLVAFASIGFALAVGTLLGILAGYRGGHLDSLVMRTMDVMLSFPLMLLSIIIVVVLGPGVLNLILAIGISQVPLFTRLARSLTLSVRTRDFVQAAAGFGATDARILAWHILPNIAAVLVVQATTTTSLAILNAASLNFLGLASSRRHPTGARWWRTSGASCLTGRSLPLYPGAAIAITVLSLNLLSDGLIEAGGPDGPQEPGLRRQAWADTSPLGCFSCLSCCSSCRRWCS